MKNINLYRNMKYTKFLKAKTTKKLKIKLLDG